MRGASRIGIACIAWPEVFDVPVVFAKTLIKKENVPGRVYTTKVESLHHSRVYDIIVSRGFWGSRRRVLLIGDFLANGRRLTGGPHSCLILGFRHGARACELGGAGIVIERIPGRRRPAAAFRESDWVLLANH